MTGTRNSARLSGTQKAAIFMALVGEEAAATIFRNLPEPDVQKVAQELSKLDAVAPDKVLQVLQEYQQLGNTQTSTLLGGAEYTERLLRKAFGDDNGKRFLQWVEPEGANGAADLSTLQKATAEQLAAFLEGEHPQTAALVLAHLEAKKAAAVLMKIPDQMRATAIKRLAQLKQFSPDTARQVSLILGRKLQSLGGQSRQTFEGFKNVAELMNQLNSNAAKAILESIEQEEPNLGIQIRNLMFTFEDLLGVPEAALRELVGSLDKNTLGLALKGASEELKLHIFRTMSSRAVEMLKEDMDAMGPVRAKEVAKAQQEAVAAARRLEAEGKLSLRAEGDDEYIV